MLAGVADLTTTMGGDPGLILISRLGAGVRVHAFVSYDRKEPKPAAMIEDEVRHPAREGLTAR